MRAPSAPARRTLLLFAAGLACLPIGSPAQVRKTARIAVVSPPEASSPMEQGVRRGLRELGYVEGENIFIDWRPTPASGPELKAVAAELARGHLDVIVVFSTPAARAMLADTQVPVVYLAGDPVAMGLAQTLARPGGRGTGISLVVVELTAKRLQLLRQIAPRARRIGLLINPSNPMGAPQVEEALQAARSLGVQIVPLHARTADELDKALAALAGGMLDAVLVGADLLLFINKAKITRAVRAARLPAIYPSSVYQDGNALLSYGPDVEDTARRLAGYVDRILRGASAGDLPVEQAAKYELVIDLRLARQLKLQVPEELLLRADEVVR